MIERERDEEELVEAAKFGDLTAFDELVRRYRPAAFLTANGILASRELADDAVQEAFISAYKSLPQLDDATRFGGWIFAIVRNRSFRVRAGETKHPLPIDELIAAHLPSFHEKIEERAEFAEIRCALKTLPPESQTVVELYYLHEWSIASIAQYLGFPKTTVKWRLHASRIQLRTLLSNPLEEIK